ncbi:MAG: TonB-dependent receptor, partial [Flavobacteriales bacterium]
MKHLFFILISFFSFTAIGQTYAVKVMGEDGVSIPFVSALVTYEIDDKEKTIQTSTNGEGEIIIDNNWKKVKVKLKHLSYQTKSAFVSKTNNVITLYLDDIGLTTFVVTGQYSESSVDESVHKVKVIDSKRIAAQGAVNLQELMEQEMNVRVSQDQFLGASMSVQGLSGENVKILIDGVPVVGRLNGNVDLSQINLTNIERVEIIEGPLSVNYGTNALAGTINLITKKNKKKFTAAANAYYETIGQYNVDGSVNFANKKHSLAINGGRNFFGGYSSQDTSRVEQWKPKEQWFGGLKYNTTIKKVNLQATTDFFREKLEARGEPRNPYQETAFDDYYTTLRSSSGLNLDFKANKNATVNILGGYNYFQRIKNRYLKDLVNIKYTEVEGGNAQDTIQFDLIFSRGTYSFAKDSSKLNYQFGYDINLESNKGKRIGEGEQRIGDYAVFGSVEYSPNNKLVIRPGLRYSYNTAYETPLVPSLNVKYQWTKHLTTRFSYGRGFRAPSLKELHFLFVDINHNVKGNELLQAESSNNLMFQMGYKRGIKRGVYNFELSGFYNAIDNQISLVLVDQVTQLYTYNNIGKFYSQGVNFNSGFRYKTYKTNIGASLVGRYNIESEANPELERFFYTPELQASFGYEVEEWQTVFNLFYKYSGRVLGYYESELDGVVQYELQGFNMMDVSVVKYFYNKKLTVTLGAKNLFDVGTLQTNQAIGGGVHSAGSNNVPVA